MVLLEQWAWKKKRKSEFFGAMMALMAASLAAPMASSLMESVASSVINAIFGKGLKGGLALPLIMKVLGKGVKRAWKDIIKWIIWKKGFSFASLFKQYRDYEVFHLRASF